MLKKRVFFFFPPYATLIRDKLLFQKRTVKLVLYLVSKKRKKKADVVLIGIWPAKEIKVYRFRFGD